MLSRFFSSFGALALLAMLGAAGCYPYGGGRAAGDDVRQLLAQARAACERGDPDAFDMLWGRLAAEDPDAVRGARAQRLDARCRQNLQSAARIGDPGAHEAGSGAPPAIPQNNIQDNIQDDMQDNPKVSR